MEVKVTIDDLLKRKESFFASYEVNVNMWDAENFDPEVDFFDLEDMLASRYWLKYLQAEGKLTEEENQKFEDLDKKFWQKKIPEFVKKHFPAVYGKWIEEKPEKMNVITALDTISVEAELQELLKRILTAGAGWTEVAISSGGKDENNAVRPAAA